MKIENQHSDRECNCKLIFKLNLEMASKRKVNVSDYDLLQTLGTGSFGRVRLTKEKTTGKYYALKIFKKHDIIKLKQVDHVMNEKAYANSLLPNSFLKWFSGISWLWSSMSCSFCICRNVTSNSGNCCRFNPAWGHIFIFLFYFKWGVQFDNHLIDRVTAP